MFKKPLMYTMLCTLFSTSIAMAEQIQIDMYLTNDTQGGIGPKIGHVIVEDSPFGGVLITPALENLPVGVHGFHVHTTPSCAPSDHEGHTVPAGAAGGHLDPAQTNAHAGPYGTGHLGDLPVLIVNPNGDASLPMLAPRLKIKDFQGHALMIHAGGDNYHDTPAPLGGGGARFACGVIS